DLQERLTVEHGERRRREQEVAEQLAVLTARLEGLRAEMDRLRRPVPAMELPPSPAVPAGLGALPATAYVLFEDRHRGTAEEIRERQRVYLDLFTGGGRVLDVGCGRGEFLELCREGGIDARGIDLDPAMVARCRQAGLAAEEADALAYLDALPDGTLGGI